MAEDPVDETPQEAPADEKSQAKAARKELARRLRATLAAGPLTLAEMVEVMGAGEDAVLKALRRVRKARKRGRLHSGMVGGQACWWWEPAK